MGNYGRIACNRLPTMGVGVSRLFSNSSHGSTLSLPSKERELLTIKNHPDRVRRRSSVAPSTPVIREEKILEDLCDSTDIEPDVPANVMGRREVHKLIKRISSSAKFTNKFHNEEQFLDHVRRLSDASASISGPSSATGRMSRLQRHAVSPSTQTSEEKDSDYYSPQG